MTEVEILETINQAEEAPKVSLRGMTPYLNRIDNFKERVKKETAFLEGKHPERDKKGRILPGVKLVGAGRKSGKLKVEEEEMMHREIVRCLYIMDKIRQGTANDDEKSEYKIKEKIWLKFMDKLHATKTDFKAEIEKPTLLK